MLRVFVNVFGLTVFVWFNCDVWRDVVWPVLRVFCFEKFFFFFCFCGVLRLRVRVCLMCSCVFGVI